MVMVVVGATDGRASIDGHGMRVVIVVGAGLRWGMRLRPRLRLGSMAAGTITLERTSTTGLTTVVMMVWLVAIIGRPKRRR